jgi:hypothetical protein
MRLNNHPFLRLAVPRIARLAAKVELKLKKQRAVVRFWRDCGHVSVSLCHARGEAPRGRCTVEGVGR